MTLLEILVKELPGKGGWPASSIFLAQDRDGKVYGFKWRPELEGENEWLDGTDTGYQSVIGMFTASSDRLTAIITREKYEAALAQKAAWNGEGLPPVGCECEVKRVADWIPVTINYISKIYTVFTSHGGTECCHQTHALQFRPIHSEEDRKRDEAIASIKSMLMYDYGDGPRLNDAVILYDAITAGKIPHIKIV